MSKLAATLSGNIISLAIDFLSPLLVFSTHSTVQEFLFSDAVKMYGRVAVFRKPRRSRTRFRRA